MQTVLFHLVTCLIVAACGMIDSPQPVQDSGHTPGALVVKISGIKGGKGFLHLALCASPAEWNGEKSYYRTARIAAAGDTVTYCFDLIPEGEYAVKVFQDENGNQTLDKDSLGIPLEGYGFSSVSRALFGPPSFRKAAFHFTGPAMNIEIALH